MIEDFAYDMGKAAQAVKDDVVASLSWWKTHPGGQGSPGNAVVLTEEQLREIHGKCRRLE